MSLSQTNEVEESAAQPGEAEAPAHPDPAIAKKLPCAFEGVGALVWEWDLERDQIEWLGDSHALFNRSPARNASELCEWAHPADRSLVAGMMAELRAGRETQSVEHRVISGEGEVRWVANRGRFIGKPDNGMRAIGAIIDITARCESEKAAVERERQLFELTGVGQSQADPFTRKFTRVNRRMELLTGYSAEELLEKTYLDITHPEDRQADVEIIQTVIESGRGSWAREKRYLRKDGSVIWVHVTGAILRDGTGRPWCCLTAVQDITQRKRAEEALIFSQEQLRRHALELESRVTERTAELQETVGSLESFCSSIAHDLRAPVRAMQGFAAVLVDNYEKQLDREGADYLRRIMLSAGRMDDLIRDLLNYGRLSGMELRIEDASIQGETEAAVSDLAGLLSESGGKVTIHPTDLRARANPVLLRQILTNLISNGLKFTRDGEPALVEVRALAEPPLCRIEVSDNGIGVAPEHQARIFNVFERLHPVSEYEGTGIGLAIVRRAVERMGGVAGLRSVAGKGSVFWVELPLAMTRDPA